MKNKKIAEEVKNTIMKDLFKDVNTQKCIIDIVINETKKIEQLKDSINKVSVIFLNKCKQQLKSESESGNILFFRKYNYEKILNEYLAKTYGIDSPEMELFPSEQKLKEQKKKLKKQEKLETKKLETDRKQKKQEKSSLKKLKNQEHIRLMKEEYQNESSKVEKDFQDIYSALVQLRLVNSKRLQKRMIEVHEHTVQRIKEHDAEFGFLIKRTYNGKLNWSLVKNSELKDNVYIAIDENGDKLLLHSYADENAFLYRFYMNGEFKKIGGIQQYLEKMILRKKPKIAQTADLTGYYNFDISKAMPRVLSKVDETVQDNKIQKRKVNIGFRDFVVRRNIFKCMHNKHVIEDIDAVVKIMNKNVEIEEVVVSAGYCKQCNMFFMLESTYQQLRKKGIVVFRAVDEKNYLNQNYLNGKILAQESVLMQFGYTVSQTEGLSEERRHKILSVLVDNHILTKSEIISYLDFFINQRKSDKYALAIAKWTIDRDYIRNYKIGEYSRIGVVYR